VNLGLLGDQSVVFRINLSGHRETPSDDAGTFLVAEDLASARRFDMPGDFFFFHSRTLPLNHSKERLDCTGPNYKGRRRLDLNASCARD
jgi:hypothetical protein